MQFFVDAADVAPAGIDADVEAPGGSPIAVAFHEQIRRVSTERSGSRDAELRGVARMFVSEK